jgi:hypothetical protein
LSRLTRCEPHNCRPFEKVGYLCLSEKRGHKELYSRTVALTGHKPRLFREKSLNRNRVDVPCKGEQDYLTCSNLKSLAVVLS